MSKRQPNFKKSIAIEAESLCITSQYDGIKVCNIFPARHDPARVEDLKRCVAKLVYDEVTNGNQTEGIK